MSKILKSSTKNVYALLFLLSIIQIHYYLMFDSPTLSIEEWLYGGTNLKLYVNTAFIIFNIYVVRKLQKVMRLIQVRLNKKDIYLGVFMVFLKLLFIYIVLVPVPIFILYSHRIEACSIFFRETLSVVLKLFMYIFIYTLGCTKKEYNWMVFLPLVINIFLTFMFR